MFMRMVLMLLAVGAVLGGVFGFQAFKGAMIHKYMTAGGPPPQTVSTVKAASQDWQPELKAVGTLRAVNGVDLTTEVAGIVDGIHFDSGADVEEGTMLLELRSDEERAHIKALKASAKLAETTLERDRQMLKSRAVSQAAVDADIAALDVAKAQVSEQRAVIEKKIILAPFSGRVGLRAVDVGQYISPGTVVATLQQTDPIYLDFTLPQQNLAQLRAGQKVTATTDAQPGREFVGEITALDAKVDAATRNVKIRATFPNPDHVLQPGMYASLAIATGAAQSLLTLPQTAITFNPYGNTVYTVVKDDKTGALTANQVIVTTGAARGDQIAVISGVKDGDEVVSAGQMKLRNGSPVLVNNAVQPSDDAAPKIGGER